MTSFSFCGVVGSGGPSHGGDKFIPGRTRTGVGEMDLISSTLESGSASDGDAFAEENGDVAVVAGCSESDAWDVRSRSDHGDDMGGYRTLTVVGEMSSLAFVCPGSSPPDEQAFAEDTEQEESSPFDIRLLRRGP